MVINEAYNFCKTNVNKKTTPKYVKKQMKDFLLKAKSLLKEIR